MHSHTSGRILQQLGVLGLAVVLLGQTAHTVQGQRVLLFEDFEGISPDPPDPELCELNFAELGDLIVEGLVAEGTTVADVCISATSVDTFNRSRVLQETDSLSTVTGATFPDPFDPGNNQSLVVHNPHASTQMAVNWFSMFPDDASDPNFYLRNGVVQFDMVLSTPQPDSLFTFLGVRFGFQPDAADRNQVTTEGDQVIWNVFNLYGDIIDDPEKAEIAANILLQRKEPQFRDNLYDQANGVFYVDPAEISGNPDDGVVVAERAIRVRYELTRTETEGSYRVTLQNLDSTDDPVELVWPGGSADRPWTKIFDFDTFEEVPAPGINEITFISDASGFAVTDVSQNVYIDNLLIIDNDLPPLDTDFDDNGRTDGADFLSMQRNLPLATGATNAQGDTDQDMDVDADDLANWKRAYGSALPALLAGLNSTATIVPEPSAAVLASIGGLLVISGVCARSRQIACQN